MESEIDNVCMANKTVLRCVRGMKYLSSEQTVELGAKQKGVLQSNEPI